MIMVAGCGANIFSIDEDVQLGKQMDQQIRSNPAEYPILNNEAVRGYVQGVVNRIIQAPEIKYRGKFPYTVTILNDDRTINAFATPGGYIYVYTGLLKVIDNESTLAGVLGHEIAHAEERHSTKQMTTQLGTEALLSIALGNNPSQLAQIAANAGALLTSLAHSRADETDADTKSVGYLRSTPYYPGAIKSFFERMQQQAATTGGGGTPEWLATHPSDARRVQNIDNLLAQYNIPAPTNTAQMQASYRSGISSLR